MPEGDAGFAQVVGRDLDVDFVPDTDADKILPHFAGDVRQHFVSIRQGDAKHRARQHLGHSAFQLDWLFFSHATNLRAFCFHSRRPGEANATPGTAC